MSDPLDKVSRLAARARAEVPAPMASVATEVSRRLRSKASAPERPLWWIASAACVLAVLTVALDYPAFLGLADPAGELADYAGWMMF